VEATVILRERGYNQLILALTGNVMDNDIHEFLVAGADTVLAKPLRCEVLNQVMDYVSKNGFTSVVSRGDRLLFCEDHFEVYPFDSRKM